MNIFKNKEKNDRFEITYSQFTDAHVEIFVDKKTGINYLFFSANGSSGGGITPLLDADGKIVITEVK
jgi:hypothetical protein